MHEVFGDELKGDDYIASFKAYLEKKLLKDKITIDDKDIQINDIILALEEAVAGKTGKDVVNGVVECFNDDITLFE